MEKLFHCKKNSVHMDELWKYDFFGVSNCKVFVPTNKDNWKRSQKSHEGELKKLGAGDLKIGTHFWSEEIDSDKWKGTKKGFEEFLDSIIKSPVNPQHQIGADGFGLQSQLHRVSGDILETATMVKSVVEDPNHQMREAEVRLTVTDCIVKGICRLTGCVFTAEESVSKSDKRALRLYDESQPSTSKSTKETPQTPISQDVTPDYKIFQIESRGGGIVTLIEAKTKASFNNENSVCQTIGYHTASRVTHSGDDTKKPNPVFAILMCETDAKLIFFPFSSDKSPCLEAIVTPSIPIMTKNGINPQLFTFMCTYIDRLCYAKAKFIIPSTDLINLHHLKTYHVYLSLESEQQAELREVRAELEESKQLVQESKQRVQESKQREQEAKQEIERLKAILEEGPGPKRKKKRRKM